MTRIEISEFYNKHKRRLFATSSRMLGSMEAEEVVHDTFMKYLKYKDGASMKDFSNQQIEAWLIKTTVRASIDVLRKRKSHLSMLDFYIAEVKDENLEWEGDRLWENISCGVNEIKQALTMLSDGYRTVLSLVLFEGYDYEEIAEILLIKEASVRSQYLRGKLKLATIIKEGNYGQS